MCRVPIIYRVRAIHPPIFLCFGHSWFSAARPVNVRGVVGARIEKSVPISLFPFIAIIMIIMSIIAASVERKRFFLVLLEPDGTRRISLRRFSKKCWNKKKSVDHFLWPRPPLTLLEHCRTKTKVESYQVSVMWSVCVYSNLQFCFLNFSLSFSFLEIEIISAFLGSFYLCPAHPLSQCHVSLVDVLFTPVIYFPLSIFFLSYVLHFHFFSFFAFSSFFSMLQFGLYGLKLQKK